jgi:hypothetical protein
VLAKFVPEVVVEVVMGTKEVQERTRKAAYDCLADIGHAIVKVQGDCEAAGAGLLWQQHLPFPFFARFRG